MEILISLHRGTEKKKMIEMIMLGVKKFFQMKYSFF